MTRKDFIAIAEALHDHFERTQAPRTDQDTVIAAISAACHQTNPNFRAGQFAASCRWYGLPNTKDDGRNIDARIHAAEQANVVALAAEVVRLNNIIDGMHADAANAAGEAI